MIACFLLCRCAELSEAEQELADGACRLCTCTHRLAPSSCLRNRHAGDRNGAAGKEPRVSMQLMLCVQNNNTG